jgi:ubiquinone/menaquinone biosynthesis C-methylase UbiE
MKSLYQNKKFAAYWNDRAGINGEIYKRMILDPLMFRTVGNFHNKTVLELGCGNGYLAPKFIKQNPRKLILMDISRHNLQYAREKCQDPRIAYLPQDATKTWKIKTVSVDIIYSNMMLNEVADIKTPISEAWRVLKPDGVFIFSVLHPSFDLYMYAQEKLGKKSNKLKGLGNYFRRGYAKFLMGASSLTNPFLYNKYGKNFEVEHYQRPVCDYFNQLTKNGFEVKNLFEPELSKKLLKENPRFREYLDQPIGLVFHCLKTKNR